MNLDVRIVEDLQQRYHRLLDQGDFPSREELARYYATFRLRFGPERLLSLDGEALLTTLHDHSNRDSLVYWLEFKNDEEFPDYFGGIGGGSALKYGIYRRSDTRIWMTGSSQRQRELSLAEAVEIARSHRDQMVRGAELLERLPPRTDDVTYLQLQQEMDRLVPDVARLAWGHKYFSLLYPYKLDEFHSEDFQRFHLIKLLQSPPPGEGRYFMAGRYLNLAEQVEIPFDYFSAVLKKRHGRPYRYWWVDVDTWKDKRYWEEMRDNGYVGIRWGDVGDLTGRPSSRESNRTLVQELKSSYGVDPAPGGRIASEILLFTADVMEGDLILAADSRWILGIGKVSGGYYFEPGTEAAHRRPVQWLSLGEWKLPEGNDFTGQIHELPRRASANLIAVEQRLLTPPPPPPRTVTAPAPLVLTGIAARIQAILERKRQVILYGPPGTGKTYQALSTAHDLAAYYAYGRPYVGLDAACQMEVREHWVQFCTFHPAYGYEDFIEGYRPVKTAAGQPAFELREGIFKSICSAARLEPERRFYLIIDEINRGDIPRIFGELLTALELDKRNRPVRLPLSDKLFTVPTNLYVIGTMNTADRSIALLDTALRRRFGFVELMPDMALLGAAVIEGTEIPLGPWLAALNERIVASVGRDARNLQIGHAYFMENGAPVTQWAAFVRILEDDILPLLEEYCYEDYEALAKILGSQLVDEVRQRVRRELFDPERREELIQALIAPAPDLVTLPQSIEKNGES